MLEVAVQDLVSTHSRLKAAGNRFSNRLFLVDCFNTQPPKGGWLGDTSSIYEVLYVSTHSRLKAAGLKSLTSTAIRSFQHTAA